MHIATPHIRTSAAFTAACSKEVAGQAKSGRTVTTMSQDCGNTSRCNRKTSLNIRLILLRRTAPRIRRCTLIPSRLAVRLLARKSREKPAPCSRRPFLYTCANSPDFLSRSSLGSPNLFTGSRGQTFSAFGPAASDDGLAALCTHPHQETVGMLAFCIAGLKCLFTHCVYSFSVLRQTRPSSPGPIRFPPCHLICSDVPARKGLIGMRDIGKDGSDVPGIKLVIYIMKILYFNHSTSFLSNNFDRGGITNLDHFSKSLPALPLPESREGIKPCGREGYRPSG